MRSRSGVKCPVPSPQGKEASLLHDLHRTVPDVAVRVLAGCRVLVHVHQLRLHHVKGQCREGADEAGQRTRPHVIRDARSRVRSDRLLNLVVGGEHAHVHGNGTANHGYGTAPEGANSLLLSDTIHRLESVLVSPALLDWSHSIRLHTNQSEVEGITDDGSERTRSHCGQRLLVKRNGLSVVQTAKCLGEAVVKSDFGGSVNGLSGDCRGQTGKETLHALILHHILCDGNGRNLSLDSAVGDLKTDLH